MKKDINIRLGRPSTSGVTILDVLIERLKETIGRMLDYCNLPGFIKPINKYDDLTKTHIKVRLSSFLTIISINGRDYYFHRLDGKFDGTGTAYKCSTQPVDCILD